MENTAHRRWHRIQLVVMLADDALDRR